MNCRAGSEATNRAAMSFLYVCSVVRVRMVGTMKFMQHAAGFYIVTIL